MCSCRSCLVVHCQYQFRTVDTAALPRLSVLCTSTTSTGTGTGTGLVLVLVVATLQYYHAAVSLDNILHGTHLGETVEASVSSGFRLVSEV